MAGQGVTTRDMAKWCLDTHGITVSHAAIAKMLRQTRETRADVAAAVTREALAPHIVSDLDRMEEIREEMAERRANDPCIDHRDAAVLARLEVEILEKKLKFSGATTEHDRDRLYVASEDLKRMAAEVMGDEDE